VAQFLGVGMTHYPLLAGTETAAANLRGSELSDSPASQPNVV
jgi:hypothetical protein